VERALDVTRRAVESAETAVMNREENQAVARDVAAAEFAVHSGCPPPPPPTRCLPPQCPLYFTDSAWL
jgi:hypothetical protein